MNKEQILILAKAGFTAEQIAALSQAREPVLVPQASPPPPTSTSPSPSPSPAPATSNDTATEAAGQIMKQLQLFGINSSEQPKPQSTDDILASIINPPERS